MNKEKINKDKLVLWKHKISKTLKEIIKGKKRGKTQIVATGHLFCNGGCYHQDEHKSY